LLSRATPEAAVTLSIKKSTVTVVVKVTDCPKTDGLAELRTLTPPLAGSTF
jgi:hypothetical protein